MPASELIDKLYADPETAPDAAALGRRCSRALLRHFKPAFLGRVTLVPYLPLSDAVIARSSVQLGRISHRVHDSTARLSSTIRR
jgi:type VI secretion system protein VasG